MFTLFKAGTTDAIFSKSGYTEFSFNKFIIFVSGCEIIGAVKFMILGTGGKVSEPAPLDVLSVNRILRISHTDAFWRAKTIG